MKKLPTLLVILSAAAMFLSACAPKPAAAASVAAANDGALIAEGSLLPINTLDQSFGQPGQIAELLVKDGDAVKNGQSLARLSSSPDANLALARAKQETLAAQQALDALQKNAALDRANAQAALADAQQALKDAQTDRYAKNLARVSQATIDAAHATLVIAQDALKKAQEDYDKYATKPETDLGRANALNRLAAAQTKADQAQYQLDWLIGRPDTLEVAKADAAIAVAQARVDDAQKRFDALKNGPDADALAAAQARLAAAQAAQTSAQAAIDGQTLKATIAGTVIDLAVQPGQRVNAGAPVLTLADLSVWLVKTDNLTENDVAAITLGQKVEVTLDALPGVTLAGEVTKINARYETKRGDVTYTVTVQLNQTDARMRWGMTAAVRFNR